MNETTKIILVGALCLLVGVGIGYSAIPHEQQIPEIEPPTSSAHTMHNGVVIENAETQNMHSAMTNMMAGLHGLSGDEFDEAFLQQMIVHHEGAIMMADAALRSAKHSEVKELSEDIIDAQTKEIEQMKKWQKEWYKK